MTLQELAPVLRQALLALGFLFVIVNVKDGLQLVNWWRMRHQAVVTWLAPKPPYFAINVAIGVLLAVLLFVTAYIEIGVQQRGRAAGVAPEQVEVRREHESPHRLGRVRAPHADEAGRRAARVEHVP